MDVLRHALSLCFLVTFSDAISLSENLSACFTRYGNSDLWRIRAFEKHFDWEDVERCQIRCLELPNCRSFVYNSLEKICELYAGVQGEFPARLMSAFRKAYYERQSLCFDDYRPPLTFNPLNALPSELVDALPLLLKKDAKSVGTAPKIENVEPIDPILLIKADRQLNSQTIRDRRTRVLISNRQSKSKNKGRRRKNKSRNKAKRTRPTPKTRTTTKTSTTKGSTLLTTTLPTTPKIETTTVDSVSDIRLESMSEEFYDELLSEIGEDKEVLDLPEDYYEEDDPPFFDDEFFEDAAQDGGQLGADYEQLAKEIQAELDNDPFLLETSHTAIPGVCATGQKALFLVFKNASPSGQALAFAPKASASECQAICSANQYAGQNVDCALAVSFVGGCSLFARGDLALKAKTGFTTYRKVCVDEEVVRDECSSRGFPAYFPTEKSLVRASVGGLPDVDACLELCLGESRFACEAAEWEAEKRECTLLTTTESTPIVLVPSGRLAFRNPCAESAPKIFPAVHRDVAPEEVNTIVDELVELLLNGHQEEDDSASRNLGPWSPWSPCLSEEGLPPASIRFRLCNDPTAQCSGQKFQSRNCL